MSIPIAGEASASVQTASLQGFQEGWLRSIVTRT